MLQHISKTHCKPCKSQSRKKSARQYFDTEAQESGGSSSERSQQSNPDSGSSDHTNSGGSSSESEGPSTSQRKVTNNSKSIKLLSTIILKNKYSINNRNHFFQPKHHKSNGQSKSNPKRHKSKRAHSGKSKRGGGGRPNSSNNTGTSALNAYLDGFNSETQYSIRRTDQSLVINFPISSLDMQIFDKCLTFFINRINHRSCLLFSDVGYLLTRAGFDQDYRLIYASNNTALHPSGFRIFNERSVGAYRKLIESRMGGNVEYLSRENVDASNYVFLRFINLRLICNYL